MANEVRANEVRVNAVTTATRRMLAHPGLVRLTSLGVLCAVALAVTCALVAPASQEVEVQIADTMWMDTPLYSQDEVRVAGEVWFAMAFAVLALVTTVAWWRLRSLRGPVGLLTSAVFAVANTGLGMLVWKAVVALRGFDRVPRGEVFAREPVLSSTSAMWVAGAVAVLTYLVFAIMASRSDLGATESAGV